MTEFDKTRWSEKNFAHEFLETADIRILERQRMLQILKSFYRHFFGDKKETKVLDLGCGDGILIHELFKIDGSLWATLIDGSGDMIKKARERLSGFNNIRFIKANFQELIHRDIQLPSSHLVVSSLAIHHLTMSEKKSLFERIFCCLVNGGHFVNIDVVLSPTENIEKWYLELWREWIIEKQEISGGEDTGDNEDFIRSHKEKEHHSKLDTLTDQLNALRDTGFNDVDCFYKYGIFAMYGGRK